MSSPGLVECGVAGFVYPGQAESGDRPVFAPFPGGALLGAVDGLGHGEDASLVASSALTILEGHRTDSVLSLVQRCHAGLKGTRGVVMSLASYSENERTLTWIGIGNVAGVLLRALSPALRGYETLLLRGGVVGFQLPTLEASMVRVSRGDTLVFATDGVRSDFVSNLTPGMPAQRMADEILHRNHRGDDDALVIAAQFPQER
jgi:hypothetical protein